MLLKGLALVLASLVAPGGVGRATPSLSFYDNTNNATIGTSLTFTDTFSDPGGDSLDNLSIAWGDGSQDAYYLDPASTTHAYTHPGTYTATATFSDEDNTYTASLVETARDDASFSINGNTLSEGSAFSLTGTFSEPAGGDTPLTYSIAWGDGNTSTYGTSPNYHGTLTHTYTEPSPSGGYTLSATATTQDGTYTAASDVTVTETSPQFTIVGLESVASGQTYNEVASFSDPAGDSVSSYVVSFGDNTTQTYTSPNFSHVYPAFNPSGSDTYSIAATAVTEDGSYTATDTMRVDPSGGAGSLTTSATSTISESRTLSVTATFADPDQGGSPGAHLFVAWGDGTVSPISAGSTLTFTHPYPEAGTYSYTVGGQYADTSNPSYNSYSYAISHSGSVVVTEVTPTFTVAGDTTATVTGDTYSLVPTFTDAGSNDTPQQWTIAWGDGASDAFNSNPPASFTHVYTTATAGTGTTYSPTVTAITDDGTYTASASVLIGQPIMNVIQGTGAAMDHNAQHTIGGFVALNDDDDTAQYDGSGNPIPDTSEVSLSSADPDLIEVDLNALPSALGGTLQLSWSTPDVAVWADPYKDVQLSSGCQFSAGALSKVYVEGRTITTQMAQDVLEETWISPAGRLVQGVDIARLTVIDLIGPQNVPSYGQYQYRVKGALPRSNAADPWSATGGTVTAERLDESGAWIAWNKPLNGATSGWFGHVVFTALGNKFTIGLRKINVINVVVTTPAGAFAGGTPFAQPGVVQSNSGAAKQVFAGNPNGYGLKWSATVTLNGPNGNTGVRRIQAGFVQNLVGYEDVGTYIGRLTRKSTIAALVAKRPILDADGDGSAVWYYLPNGRGSAVFDDAGTQNNQKTISTLDLPRLLTPVTFEKHPHQQQGDHLITRMDAQDTFNLSVCAKTLDAPAAFVREAAASYLDNNGVTAYGWLFNASGTIQAAANLPWTPTPSTGVIAPTTWAAVTDGSSPIVSGITANNLAKQEDFQ